MNISYKYEDKSVATAASKYLRTAATLACGALCLLTSIVRGQELTGAVTVEGDYMPDIIHPERINMLPGLERYRSSNEALPYALDGVEARFRPAFLPLPSTSWGASRSLPSSRGYLELSLGSWLDANLSAGYSILRSDESKLNVWLQHNSTSLWRPYPDVDARRWSYQESAGADFSHRFTSAGTLSASLQYRLGCFDYYGYHPSAPSGEGGAEGIASTSARMPTQTLNDIAFRAGWRPEKLKGTGGDYFADLRVRYFGYRKGERETDLSLSGGYSLSWDRGSQIGIAGNVEVLLYGASEGYKAPDTYGMVTLTPYYEFIKRNMRLRLGADVDITANAAGNTSDTHYSLFHIAPDVRFDIKGKGIGFYAHALGGSELHTLAGASQTDPYCMPSLISTQPVYTPLDLRIGLEAGPFAGFSAGIEARYRYSMHLPLEGWYSAMLNGRVPSVTDLRGIHLSGCSAALRLRYNYGERLRISAEGSYQPQDGEKGYFNGLDRPRWTAEAEIIGKPVEKLSLSLSYRLRAVRHIYRSINLPSSGSVMIEGTPDREIIGERLPDTSTLDFSASWQLTPRIALTLRGCNLLDRHETLLPDLISEGINFRGGVNIIF